MSEPVDPSSRPLDELDERYAAHDASLGNQLALSLTPATSARSEDPSRTPQGTAGDGAGHDVDVDLRSHLRMLRRRWKVVAAVTVVIVALAVGWSLAQPERYRAGVDLLIPETHFDLLAVKAAVIGVRRAMAKVGRQVPIQCQVTMELTGRMLVGTEIAAAPQGTCNTVLHVLTY